MEKRFKRKHIFIEKKFQIKFISIFIVILILGSFVSGALLYFLSNQELGRSFYSAHSRIKNLWEILLPAVLTTSFTTVIMISLLAVFVVLFLSHKIAGPLYRFEKSLEEVGKGNLSLYTKLRDDDEIKPVAKTFNQMTTDLNQKISKIKEETGDTLKLVKKLDSVLHREEVDLFQAKEISSNLLEQTGKLSNSFQSFKLK